MRLFPSPMNIMNMQACLASCALVAYPAMAGESKAIDTGKVVASLVSSHDVVSPGQTTYIALRTEIDDHWHTYWKNPGDSGEPLQIDWDLPGGVTSHELNWPIPHRLPTGPIVNYGFEGTPLFPVAFDIDPELAAGTELTITGNFYYLVCYDVCLPEEGSASLSLTVGETQSDLEWMAPIDAALAASPKPVDTFAKIAQPVGDEVMMSFDRITDIDVEEAYFFPFDAGVVEHSAEQVIEATDDGFTLRSTPSFAWKNKQPEAFSGVLVANPDGDAKGYEVTLTIDPKSD